MTQNPNWPLLQVLWSPTTNAVYDANLPIYTDITLRCLKQWIVQYGRQYELDQMQAGTFQTTLNNRDGAFNPVSAASVFAPGVLPERAINVQAQWPPTANLLSGDLATAGEVTPIAPGSIPASMQINSDVAATLTIASSGSAFQGAQVFQGAVPASITTGFYILKANYIPIRATTIATPATTYTWSTYVRCTTSGINPQVAAAVKWYNASGAALTSIVGSTVTLTGATSASWTRVAVTGTPPAGAVRATIAVAAEGTPPASTWTYQQDGLQFEMAASASTWTAPGTWYPIYAGNVERYPNVYDLSGTRGLAQIQASDALGLLSQSILTASLDGLIANPAGDNSAAGAVFNYTLGDQGSNQQYADALGLRASASALPGKYGLSTITVGVPVTSTTPGDGFLGATQTVTEFTAPGGPGGGVGAAISAVALPPGPNGQYGPGSGTGLGYTRMIAFKCITAPTSNGSVLWYAAALGNYAQGIALLPGGTVIASVIDANHSGSTSIGSYDVGNWHLAWLGMAADGSSFLAGIDSSVSTFSAGANDYAYPAGFLQDIISAQGESASNPHVLAYNLVGDLALYVEWPELLTAADIAAIYAAWRTGYTGDTPGERAINILNWAGYRGAYSVDSGVTPALGAATDVVDIDAVTALQAVVTTEGGEHFMAPDGTYTFYARSRRLGAYTPAYSFGSATGSGEIPFEDVQFDFDPTLIENDVTNTQVSTGQNFYSVNEPSATTFGARSLEQSNQSSNPQDVQDQADWYAGVYGYPRIRVASLTLHPAANPSVLWPVCLSLRLGQYVKVTQRPMGSAVGALDPVTMYGFIENIQITGQNTADATWVLQISPDVASGGGPSQPALEPWNLALLHTTLASSATAGTNTITINALPTAATSTLAQNLPQGGPGFHLTIGSGLGTQETLTIQSVSTTVVGYTTATITFTGNLANSHGAGEIVRETLGGASASTWQSLDAYSTLGTAMITY